MLQSLNCISTSEVRGKKEKCSFSENVDFPFDHQAKMWPADDITKEHV
jgi:hypothetical protein